MASFILVTFQPFFSFPGIYGRTTFLNDLKFCIQAGITNLKAEFVDEVCPLKRLENVVVLNNNQSF